MTTKRLLEVPTPSETKQREEILAGASGIEGTLHQEKPGGTSRRL